MLSNAVVHVLCNWANSQWAMTCCNLFSERNFFRLHVSRFTTLSNSWSTLLSRRNVISASSIERMSRILKFCSMYENRDGYTLLMHSSRRIFSSSHPMDAPVASFVAVFWGIYTKIYINTRNVNRDMTRCPTRSEACIFNFGCMLTGRRHSLFSADSNSEIKHCMTMSCSLQMKTTNRACAGRKQHTDPATFNSFVNKRTRRARRPPQTREKQCSAPYLA